jgi:exonuclease SbcC
MKLLRLEIRNFKPFKQLSLPDDDQELPGGLILIRGPNSTGKSSLLEAVLWGLWGPDAIELANDEIVSFTSTHCTVIMEFRVAGSEYKIHREYNSADGLSVVLFARRGDAWKRIADKTMSVKSKIDEILSLDYKQALQTLLVRQGEVSVIANATPVILRKLLEDIYDIGLLRQMESHLENMEKDIGLKVDALNRDFERPESIRQQIEQHEGRIR